MSDTPCDEERWSEFGARIAGWCWIALAVLLLAALAVHVFHLQIGT